MMKPTVLLVDDKDTWGSYLAGRLREEGFDVIWVKSKPDAIGILALDESKKIDAVITNINLEDTANGFLDTRGCDILQYVLDHRPELPRIALSALRNAQENSLWHGGTALAQNLSNHYKAVLVIKGEVDPTPELVMHLHQLISERTSKKMDWAAVIAVVVSAVSPYVATLGTKAAEAVISGGISELWKWVHQRIETSEKPEAKKLLEDFKQEPAKHQAELTQTLLVLAPKEDPALRKLTQNLFQELFDLLDDPNKFTLSDLKRVCSRIDVHWEDEIAHPTKEALARWVVNYVQANQKEQELIEVIVKLKPTVFEHKAK